MPEAPQPPPRPAFRRQAMALLALAALQMRNQFSRISFSRKGMRAATAKDQNRRIFVPALVILLFVAISFNMGYQAVHGLAQKSEQKFPRATSTIRVTGIEYFRLRFLSQHPQELDGDRFEQTVSDFEETVASDADLDRMEVKPRARRLIAHLKEHGIQEFARSDRFNPYTFQDLRELSPAAGVWFSRVVGFIGGCLIIALALMPLSTRTKDLGAVDSQLEWLYSLPLGGGEILTGRFVSMVFVRPLAWIIVWPVSSVLFWAMGLGWAGLVLGLFASLACSVIAAGTELAIETWMRTKGSFRAKKNVQAAAIVIGTLCFYIALAAGFVGSQRTGWIEWILDKTPAWLTAIPGTVMMLPTVGVAGLFQFIAVVSGLAILFGFGGWYLSAASMRHGLSSGNEREGKRAAGATEISQKPPNLSRFEWLLLIRDKNLAVQVIVVPLMLVGYQLLISPQMLTGASGHHLAVMAFGCGAWASMMTAPQILLSEGRNIWMVFSLPVEIATYFERRTKIWRFTAVVMAAFVIACLAIWKGGIPIEHWWRVVAALAGVWVMSLVIYAIMIGDAELPDPAQGERPKISVVRMYLCMFVAAIYGSVLWHAGPWHVLASLVIWGFLGTGLWQGINGRLRHLMEPTEKVPPELTLATALFAVLVFFLVQVLTVAILFAITGELGPSDILISFVAGGGVALATTSARLTRHQLKLPELPPAIPTPALVRDLALSVVACVAVGFLWIYAIHNVPPLREIYEEAQAGSALFDINDLGIILLATVAAPILEELLFRRYIFRIMQAFWSPAFAIFASALLFAIVHPALSFPPVFLLGLATAWIYQRSGKIWTCMLLHALYNAAVLALN